MSVDLALNALMYISAFIGGIYMWKSGGSALSGVMWYKFLILINNLNYFLKNISSNNFI